MGVTGLWTVLQPCARPIKIETLNKKRLAVDASIWIYQFLKAVRDKEGNALRNSHIVGFFRRICKLLFFGIKPVFVFDGGAPVLKRQTINSRKSRREGRREDAVRTAGKLLALQMQRAAEDEEKKRKEAVRHPHEETEQIPENVVYAEEVFQTQQERLNNRTFKRKDQYHLPELGASLEEMGGPDDPRIMSLEELEEYARQFDTGEDINIYDFSKIDYDSPFFVSLPASDRYNILNAARLRSRLRMGYSKDQLDIMFPDRMAFSRFQIERVRERNELTQRLMNLNGMNDDVMFGVNGVNRVAGEKAREYVLVRNEGAEGGWALGVVSNKDEGKAEKPIDVDRPQRPDLDEEWEDEEDFEDVPIEGLNRLPKPKFAHTSEGREGRDFISRELNRRRQEFYQSRKEGPSNPKPRKSTQVNQDPDSLFLADENEGEEWENVPIEGNDEIFEEPRADDEEEAQLRQAIALSLQPDGGQSAGRPDEELEEDVMQEIFHQERAKELDAFSSARGSGLAIARMANQRSNKLAPTGPFNESESEDEMDLQAALAESRKSKRVAPVKRPFARTSAQAPKPAAKPTNAPGFDGPLPFEKLNLGKSLLGKKKMEKLEEDNSGGFVKEKQPERNESVEPLPPWFSGERDIEEELATQRGEQIRDSERTRKEEETEYQFQELPRLQRNDYKEIIDLEASQSQDKTTEAITVDSDDESMDDVLIEDAKLRMGDVAHAVRAVPPQLPSEERRSPQSQDKTTEAITIDSDDEPIEWSESDHEAERQAKIAFKPAEPPAKIMSKSPSLEFEDVLMRTEISAPQITTKSPSPEFEDVPMNTGPATQPAREPSPERLEGPDDLLIPIVPASGVADGNALLDDFPDDDSDQYSDPEDAELFASLAKEAEEHNRFAQELSNNTAERINFNEELKQLRAQQKKDRRDADEVTQTMIAECQHLLTLFGLPYVTSPMEAEAQCAELVNLGLVDGIVTDDSDTFLFGGTRVYKNMFNAAKFVECYLSNDLVSEFALTREKLIAIAQLLGSDYTPGIPGIGPVTALEILSEFPDLQDFKTWWSGVQDLSIPKEVDKNSPFRRRFRRSQMTKLFLPPGFPDPRVAEAYLFPDVDSDPQPFQWGVPDLAALRNFLSSQIGWSWERTDEVLVPVIRDMNRREKEGTQSNITRFFEGSVGAGAFAPRVRNAGNGGPSGKKKGKGATGKRLGAALTRLAQRERADGGTGRDGGGEEDGRGDSNNDGQVEHDSVKVVAADSADGGKRKKRKPGRKAVSSAEDINEEDEEDLKDEPKKKTRRTGSRKRAA